ncbi:MAG: hypothetical protein V4486_03570 [Patescibacteria group bacterium]
MKNKNLQRGFIPFLIIAIIAVLAIGGGVYISKKNKEAKLAAEDNLNTQANGNADANANVNAHLGINSNSKGSLRKLLGLGKDTTCTFTSTAGGVNSSGTVYVSAAGSMRGDFTSNTSAGTKTSSMIVKDGTTYAWSGSQGAKMEVKATGGVPASASAKSNVDLDSAVDYSCTDWTVDQSKFTLPTGVNFVDVDALLKLKAKI